MRKPRTHFAIALLALFGVLCSSSVVALAACLGDCPGMKPTSCCPSAKQATEPGSADTGPAVLAPRPDCCSPGAIFESAPAAVDNKLAVELGKAPLVVTASASPLRARLAQARWQPPPQPPRPISIPTRTIVLLR